MDIVNIDDHRKIWRTDAAACAACGHKWQAVYPMGAGDVGLECPSCGSGLGSVLPYEDNRGLSSNGDIVERLRICAAYDPDQAEAADEIERLRQRNAELMEVLRSIAANTCCDGCQEAALVARAAIAKATGGE